VTFVRVKTIKGRPYHYLVENQRTADGKVRQKTIACLSHWPTVPEAIAGLKEQRAHRKERAEYLERCIQELKQTGRYGRRPAWRCRKALPKLQEDLNQAKRAIQQTQARLKRLHAVVPKMVPLT
jgi:hypothetical protein